MSVLTPVFARERSLSGLIKRHPLASIYIVTLMHASQNTWSNLLSDNSARPFYFTVLLTWAIALTLIAVTPGRLGYQPSETE